MTDLMERNTEYGYSESNGLINGKEYHKNFYGAETVEWTDSRLKRITRFRLLSDPGFPYWDVSYIHGELKDGSLCRVNTPFIQIPKGRQFFGFIIREAKKDGVYAKGLGLLDEYTYSKLC